MKTHVALRTFDGAGKTFAPGQRMDATGFRNVATLESARFIRPLRPDELTTKPAAQANGTPTSKPAPSAPARAARKKKG